MPRERGKRLSYFYRVKQPIPLSTIKAANETNSFPTLRVWVVLKQLSRNTILFNLNYSNLSKITGISHTSLRWHIRRMVEMGLAKHQHRHLHLTGINKLKKHDRETCVLVPVERSKSKQILQFQKALIHRNIKNQEKQIKIKRGLVNHCNRPHGKVSKRDIRLLNKSGGVKKLANSIQSVTTLANKTIGKMFSRSQNTGHRIQKKLREAGLIKTKARFELFKAIATPFEAAYLNSNFESGYIFNYANGSVYRRLSNVISV
mgnify:CR=1 FL=1